MNWKSSEKFRFFVIMQNIWMCVTHIRPVNTNERKPNRMMDGEDFKLNANRMEQKNI